MVIDLLKHIFLRNVKCVGILPNGCCLEKNTGERRAVRQAHGPEFIEGMSLFFVPDLPGW